MPKSPFGSAEKPFLHYEKGFLRVWNSPFRTASVWKQNTETGFSGCEL